jgi:hypothetical protein
LNSEKNWYKNLNCKIVLIQFGKNRFLQPTWPVSLLAHWPVGPADPPAHPAHLAGLNQPTRVWVGQTDPAQSWPPPLSSPSPLSDDLIASAAARRFRPAPLTLVGATLCETCAPASSTTPPSGISRRLLYEEIGMVLLLRICRLSSPPVGCFGESPLLCRLNNL